MSRISIRDSAFHKSNTVGNIRFKNFPPESKPDLSTTLSKTKLCSYFKVGCKNAECSFAHSKSELKPVICKFSSRCRKDDCWYYHPGDKVPSQDELYETAIKDGKFFELRETRDTRKPQIDRSQFKIKVDLTEDDDSECSTRVATPEPKTPTADPYKYSDVQWQQLAVDMGVNENQPQSQPVIGFQTKTTVITAMDVAELKHEFSVKHDVLLESANRAGYASIRDQLMVEKPWVVILLDTTDVNRSYVLTETWNNGVLVDAKLQPRSSTPTKEFCFDVQDDNQIKYNNTITNTKVQILTPSPSQRLQHFRVGLDLTLSDNELPFILNYLNQRGITYNITHTTPV